MFRSAHFEQLDCLLQLEEYFIFTPLLWHRCWVMADTLFLPECLIKNKSGKDEGVDLLVTALMS